MRRPALAMLLLLGAAGCGAPAAAVHPVEIAGFRFVPDTLTVNAGDTVVWRNGDVVPHTATGPGGAWDTGSIAAGASGRWVAKGAGSHGYVCALHPTMRGVVVVK